MSKKRKVKVKCQRCLDIRALELSIKNSDNLRDFLVARGYEGVDYVDEQATGMLRDLADLRAKKCSCVFETSLSLPV